MDKLSDISWPSRYVVYRAVTGKNELEEVFNTSDFKQAKYWIRYIAQVGDALFITPSHQKHPGGELAVYQCHKVKSGVTETDDKSWFEGRNGLRLPTCQKSTVAATS
ncbi:MAG: hypothetical protein IT291_06475 [Deltaproteobacteria bacterium]|nr:hypothetical protein [Deltaproteobacteria bacterium]